MIRMRQVPPFLAALALIVVLGACTRVSRQRTLPPSIRTVHIPMIINRSAEPGLEEDATRLVQKEFLADGRLELARNPREADAILEITIKDFLDDPVSLDSDDFTRRLQLTIEADVRIVQNIPGKPVFGGSRKVISTTTYTNDKRRINYTPEPEGKALALQRFAQLIVREVLTGSYTDDT
ncbi:MAG: hypothetical protein PWP23_1618 [Candidatus Sumerlaeota bacterium]|nr:hypothetical protein [Candidatus Sumerlaeota bacterium]